MLTQRAHRAAIAAASDGSVLINVVELLPADVQAQLSDALGATQLFVGVPLGQREAANVVAKLDGAAAEASAMLLGGGTAALPKPKRARKASRRVAAKRR